VLRDLQACLGLKDHLDLREPVGTLDQRVTMDLLVLPDNLDLPGSFPSFHLIFSSSAMLLSNQADPRGRFGEIMETVQLSRGHSRTATLT
jgi:hypothetical protein